MIQTWSTEGSQSGTSAIIAAARRKGTTGIQVSKRAAQYPRLPARRALERLLENLAGGVESYLEHFAMTRVFTGRGFAGFTRQHPVRVAGRKYVVDMWHEEARIAVELDGRQFHAGDEARRRDLERDTDLASIGIVTVRFTFEDITGRPEWCRSRLRAVLAARMRAAA